MQLNTRAYLDLADVARLMPACSMSTHGLQSILNLVAPGLLKGSAWIMAQASAPSMSVIQEVVMPLATATTQPMASSTTKAHPHLAMRLVGPSSLEPSEYTVPEKSSSAGLTRQ